MAEKENRGNNKANMMIQNGNEPDEVFDGNTRYHIFPAIGSNEYGFSKSGHDMSITVGLNLEEVNTAKQVSFVMPDGSQIDLSTGNGIVHQEILVIHGRGLVKDDINERGDVVFKVLDMDRASPISNNYFDDSK